MLLIDKLTYVLNAACPYKKMAESRKPLKCRPRTNSMYYVFHSFERLLSLYMNFEINLKTDGSYP